MSRSIVQLISGAPPLVNGVGDYALTVARALRAERGIDSIFVVCNPNWSGPGTIDGFRLVPFESHRDSDLCEAIAQVSSEQGEQLPVLLQFSPYGFADNGAPFWLLHGLRRWKEIDNKRRLFTYFHELYAMNAPWRRGFWRSPLQRYCAQEFAKVSDSALTSMERYVARLVRWDLRKAGNIPCLPVVSNVGEPYSSASLEQRSRRLVIWGSAIAKREIYTRHREVIQDAVRAVGIEYIADVGPRWAGTPEGIADAHIIPMGVLPAPAVSDVLSSSLLAACSYNPNYLAKSTLFAAYCAHRIPAIVLPTHPVERCDRDGVRLDHNYMVSAPAELQGMPLMKRLERVAAEAHAWYAGHTASKHASVIAKIIADSGAESDSQR